MRLHRRAERGGFGFIALQIWRGQGFAIGQRRAAQMPVRGLLESVARLQYACIVAGPADQLHAQRQTVAGVTAGQRQRGSAAGVGGGADIAFEPEILRAVIFKTRRRAETAGEQDIKLLEHRTHVREIAPVLAQRLHIIR